MADTNNGSRAGRVAALMLALILAPAGASAQQVVPDPMPAAMAQSTAAKEAAPTALATELVRREIASLQQLLEAEIRGASELNKEKILSAIDKLQTRLDGMDKAITLLQMRADKVPSDTDIAVTNLKLWVTAKLDDITNRLITASETALQKEAVNKSAINDALVAVKQQGDKQNEFTAATATKTENNFSKQFEAVQGIVVLNKGNSDRQINDITERIAKLEGVIATVGSIQSTVTSINDRVNKSEGNSTGASSNLVLIMMLVSTAGTIVAIIIAVMSGRRKDDDHVVRRRA